MKKMKIDLLDCEKPVGAKTPISPATSSSLIVPGVYLTCIKVVSCRRHYALCFSSFVSFLGYRFFAW